MALSAEQLTAAYQRWSGTDDGIAILADLKGKCLANPNQDVIDNSPHVTAYNVGLNSIWKYIEKQLTAEIKTDKQAEFAIHETVKEI